jgi:hypothetical protein
MKAVLGVLFLFSGLTVGWLVISGKLPSTTKVVTGAQEVAVPTHVNEQPGEAKRSGGATPVGLFAGAFSSDHHASRGYR